MIRALKDFVKGRSYPTNILIFEDRDTGVRFKSDKGKRVETRDGEIRYQLLKNGATTKPIPRESAVATTMNGRDVIVLYSPADKTFYPMHFNKSAKELKAVGEDLRVYAVMQEQLRQQKYRERKEGFAKLAPILLPVVLGVTIVLILYGAWSYGGAQIVNAYASTARDLVTISENMARCSGQVIR